MASLIVGPDAAQLAAAAESIILRSFEGAQLQRGRYLAKVDAARRHLAGDDQPSILAEAEIRGVEPVVLAETIDANARRDEAEELVRVRMLLQAREAAKLPPAKALTVLRALLADRGLSF